MTEVLRAAETNRNQLPSSYRLYTEYQEDPLGFCRRVLRTTFTDDVAEVVCSVRDNVWTIARSANGVGKTHCAAHIAIWFYKCFPNAQIYTSAAPPFSNLRKLLWGEIGRIARRVPEIFTLDTARTLHIERTKYEFITGVSIPSSGKSEEREAKFSGKHAPHLMFILDEADAIPFEVYKGIESCISGGHVRVLGMFNPRNKSSKVFQMERAGEANVVTLSAFTHPNVKTGKDLIPGAVTRQRTLQRLHRWTRPLAEGEKADAETFDLPPHLAGVASEDDNGIPLPPLPPGKRKVTVPEFFYMVLGEYAPQAPSQLIAEEWIYNAQVRWKLWVAQYGEKPPEGAAGILGADVADLGEDKNAICLRTGGFVERIRTWSGIDTLSTGDRIVEILRGNNIAQVMIDAIGVGAGVPVQVRRVLARSGGNIKTKGQGVFAVKVSEAPTIQVMEDGIPVAEFKTMRDQVWWMVREWLRKDSSAMLPPDSELVEELIAPTYEIKGKYIRIMAKEDMKEILGRSPDRAESLCMTFAPGNRSFKFNLV